MYYSRNPEPFSESYERNERFLRYHFIFYKISFLVELKKTFISFISFIFTDAIDYNKKAECCWLSYEPENEIARRLYRSYEFVETGEMDGEELIAVRTIFCM